MRSRSGRPKPFSGQISPSGSNLDRSGPAETERATETMHLMMAFMSTHVPRSWRQAMAACVRVHPFDSFAAPAESVFSQLFLFNILTVLQTVQMGPRKKGHKLLPRTLESQTVPAISRATGIATLLLLPHTRSSSPRECTLNNPHAGPLCPHPTHNLGVASATHLLSGRLSSTWPSEEDLRYGVASATHPPSRGPRQDTPPPEA